MPHEVLQYPVAPAIYPDEVAAECPEAMADIDMLIRRLRESGPSPDGYTFKNLGKRKKGLWQINLKIDKRQVRVLYAPYGQTIVLFRIHKKGSPQEQDRAYDLAVKRKRDYEQRQHQEELLAKRKTHDGNRTAH